MCPLSRPGFRPGRCRVEQVPLEAALKSTNDRRPVIALAMGDPAGISPELTAKLLASQEAREAARIVVIADRRVLEEGARVAGVAVDVQTVRPGAAIPSRDVRPI